MKEFLDFINDMIQGYLAARIAEESKEADTADKVRLLKIMGITIFIWVLLIGVYIHFQK